MKIKVSKYIAEYLAKNNILDCFMVTGGGAMHLDDALGHQKEIRCIFNHHEQASAIAAEGYARMTGRLAAVCVTSGPGGTNAITGVVGGWLDSIPMLILSGQVKRETTIWSCQDLKLRQLGDQEFDIVHSVKNMTKYAVMITNPLEIAYHLEKALFLAMEGRRGPVWLDIPLDVQGAEIETDDLIHFNACIEYPWKLPEVKNDIVRQIMDKIAQAKAPLLLVGTGIRLADAEEDLLKLIDKLQIPVATAWNANDTIAFDNPYFVGMPGTVGTRAGNFAVQNCDLLISIGCRLNIRMIGYNHYNFAQNAYKIVVDIDANELAKPTIKVDLPVHADARHLIALLCKADYHADGRHNAWLSWCKNLLYKYPVVEPAYSLASEPINPYVFIDKLFAHFDNKERIICGNGSACVMTFQAGKIKQGQRMFTNSGCAAMGYGFPASIGVAVSANTRRTVCIDGDGSLMMNVQELATVAKNKLNIKLFVINNNGYHSIRQTQSNLFQPPFIGIDGDSGLGFPDFAKLADAFGINYFRISAMQNCDKTIEEVLMSDSACICEVIVDSKQNFAPKSASRLLENGKIVSTSMEDMAPFLPREEFEQIKF